MHLEEFAQGRSLWHRTDPRVKVAAAVAFALVTAAAHRMPALVLAAGLGLGALLTARLAPRQVGVRLAVVNGFVLFLWLFLPFTTPGEAVARWGPLVVHREGLQLALAITLKANAVVAVMIALLGTSTVFDLVHALVHLRVPTRLAQLFFFCYRYISVIHQEYTTLRNAMRMRCFRPRNDLHTYRSLAYLLGMLFVRSSDRSERIYHAMVLRGFRGTFWTLDHFRMRRSDWGVLALWGCAVAGIGVLQLGVLR